MTTCLELDKNQVKFEISKEVLFVVSYFIVH